MYEIIYNNVKSSDLNLKMYDFAIVSPAKINYSSYSVAGRDGELIGTEMFRSNITISCEFSIVSDDVRQVVRAVKKWLSGSGKLILSDSPMFFYEVVMIEYGDLERELFKYGRFSVSLICYPYEFLESGIDEVSLSKFSCDNQYDQCMPLYRIVGNGECIITVNGVPFVANLTEQISIDSRLEISYDFDKKSKNTDVKGDYESLWLPSGLNSINASDGFDVYITPRWGYKA